MLECTNMFFSLMQLRRNNRVVFVGTFDLLLKRFKSFRKVLFDKVPRGEKRDVWFS